MIEDFEMKNKLLGKIYQIGLNKHEFYMSFFNSPKSEQVNLDTNEKDLLKNITATIFKINELHYDSRILNILEEDLILIEEQYNHTRINLEESNGRHSRLVDSLQLFSEILKKFSDSITTADVNIDQKSRKIYIDNLKEIKDLYVKSLNIRHLDNRTEQLMDKLNELSRNVTNFESVQSNVDQIFNDLKSKNEKFNSFVDEHNNLAEKDLYDKIYDIEISLADKYRNWALIIFLIVGSLILLIIFFSILQNIYYINYPNNYIPIEFGLSHFIKFVSIFALAIPGWYLTRESSKHRQVAYKAKIVGTELGSLPYYMNQLTDDQRKEMRIQMVDKFFGQELYNEPRTDSNSTSNDQSKLTAEALKAVTILATKKISS